MRDVYRLFSRLLYRWLSSHLIHIQINVHRTNAFIVHFSQSLTKSAYSVAARDRRIRELTLLVAFFTYFQEEG